MTCCTRGPFVQFHLAAHILKKEYFRWQIEPMTFLEMLARIYPFMPVTTGRKISWISVHCRFISFVLWWYWAKKSLRFLQDISDAEAGPSETARSRSPRVHHIIQKHARALETGAHLAFANALPVANAQKNWKRKSPVRKRIERSHRLLPPNHVNKVTSNILSELAWIWRTSIIAKAAAQYLGAVRKSALTDSKNHARHAHEINAPLTLALASTNATISGSMIIGRPLLMLTNGMIRDGHLC